MLSVMRMSADADAVADARARTASSAAAAASRADARAEVEVRAVTESEFAGWVRALNTGFLRSPGPTDAELEGRRARVGKGLDRVRGAFDGERCVATFHSFPQRLTAVGGASVAADAVSSVTVSPTHRRRGLLSRMMATDLSEAKERGDVVSTLIAAEYPIYGRYGFGPATWATEWTVDVPRAGLDPRWSGPECGGRIDLVDGAAVRAAGPVLHERFRAGQPGAVDRDELWWPLRTGGKPPLSGAPWTEPFQVLYRSPSGEVEGQMTYTLDDRWGDAKQPQNTATVEGLIATTAAAERALWRYVCSIDWVTRVKSGARAPDSLLPHLLPDPRAAAVTTHSDWLWIRVLDAVRALEARTYGASGALVLEVTDRAGLAGGRYRLETEGGTAAGGAVCTPTTQSAELALDVSELAVLWTGDDSVERLVALGRVTEERPGAVALADAMFRTSRRAWCPDMF